MLLITGATGQLGTAVIQQLLRRTPAHHIAALVRDERKAAPLSAAGVHVRVGHYDDPGTLDAAMPGVSTVLLIAGTDEQRRVQQHRNVIEAARRAGVQCLAYTSRDLRDPATLTNTLMLGHVQTEDLIRASGLNHLIFRNILYLDAVLNFVGPDVLDAGIQLPTGDGRVAFALRSELGEAIANALLDEPRGHTTYHLTGSAAYSFADVAAALSDLSGRPVKYTPLTTAAFAERLHARGVPNALAQRIIGFLTDIRHGQEDHVTPDLARLLGRPPAGLHDGLATLFRLPAPHA
ncbi:SDR family oxidoreductase [Deinococcus maricopensis]|uniref:Male sterility domain protein n=1 Tax=Deinococcus maricopensis (strain DSM 21211 / LMG 22137 / NRRL B-23946 / LB-34) TaxID=709986 RepID=E8U309_DEIML|nr:SDR family oxidoreductase [Deinococcus maricopensis]ADV65747.1 Male sterility domain protein [Deinococcus maricopensis DSM 21211]